MANTNFPTAIDVPVDPTPTSPMNSPDHAGEHSFANDAIVQLETAVGITGQQALITVGGSAGAPTTGTYRAGQQYVDTQNVIYICIVAGTPGTWIAPKGQVIAYAEYQGSPTNSYTINGTSLAAIDATNVKIVATVPPSGNVKVRWSCFLIGNSTAGTDPCNLGLMQGAGPTQVGAVQRALYNNAASVPQMQATWDGLLTGLSVGTAYTFYPAAYTSAGSFVIDVTNLLGYLRMEVLTA